MATFGNKILGLAAAAISFAGMAYGQATCSTNPSVTPTFIRGEGTTELIGTISVTCSAVSAGPLSVQVYLTPGLPITSRLLTGSTTLTEATAIFDGQTISGTIGGSGQVNFAFGTLAASTTPLTMSIGGIRVNANSLSVGSGLPPAITATVFTSGSGVANAGSVNIGNVAFAQNGLGTAKTYKTIAGAYGGTGSGVNSFTICNATTVANPAYVVQVNEGFNTAFKTQANEAAGGVAATSGTRLAVTFANLPQNSLTAFLPLTVKSAVAGSAATLSLTTSATGAFTAPTAVSTAPGNTITFAGGPAGAYGAPVSFTVTGGTFTAYYEVTTDDAINTDSYNIPVYFNTSANPGNASGTSTVAVSFAPIGSTNVPNFTQTSTTTTVSGSGFNLCTTSLLFPFVTNASGFDTGLAISNTSVDPFGTTNGAAPQGGTCTLNFYGATTNPTPVTSANVAAGTVYTNLISTLTPGFQGYMIAQCNFQFAHGFAFITDGFGGGGRGLSQGYLALVIPDTNQTARRSNPTGESLGF